MPSQLTCTNRKILARAAEIGHTLTLAGADANGCPVWDAGTTHETLEWLYIDTDPTDETSYAVCKQLDSDEWWSRMDHDGSEPSDLVMWINYEADEWELYPPGTLEEDIKAGRARKLQAGVDCVMISGRDFVRAWGVHHGLIER